MLYYDLLQKKELFRLQAFLSYLFTRPESDMIKDIFTMYDRDQSGKDARRDMEDIIVVHYDCTCMTSKMQFITTPHQQFSAAGKLDETYIFVEKEYIQSCLIRKDVRSSVKSKRENYYYYYYYYYYSWLSSIV